MYFYAVKDVLINSSNIEDLKVDKLTMLFSCRNTKVGTIISPNAPDGISKMFDFDFSFI
jgi:hypothetical protein